MKAILMSIKPKWVAKILNEEKMIEIRKRFPLGYRGWVYIYCTKDKPNLWLPYEYDCFELDEASQPYLSDKPIIDIDTKMNGKVVARFWCDNVEEISYNYRGDITSVYTDTLDTEDLEKKACLTKYEFAKYLQGDYGYAIHISQLEIFDDPRELCEFRTYKTYDLGDLHNCHLSLTKSPQSWQYIEAKGE